MLVSGRGAQQERVAVMASVLLTHAPCRHYTPVPPPTRKPVSQHCDRPSYAWGAPGIGEPVMADLRFEGFSPAVFRGVHERPLRIGRVGAPFARGRSSHDFDYLPDPLHSPGARGMRAYFVPDERTLGAGCPPRLAGDAQSRRDARGPCASRRPHAVRNRGSHGGPTVAPDALRRCASEARGGARSESLANRRRNDRAGLWTSSQHCNGRGHVSCADLERSVRPASPGRGSLEHA